MSHWFILVDIRDTDIPVTVPSTSRYAIWPSVSRLLRPLILAFPHQYQEATADVEEIGEYEEEEEEEIAE